jgi:hypothetical protein
MPLEAGTPLEEGYISETVALAGHFFWFSASAFALQFK